MLEHLIGKEVDVYLKHGESENGEIISETFIGTLESIEDGLATLRDVKSLVVGSSYTSDTLVINMRSPVFIRLGIPF